MKKQNILMIVAILSLLLFSSSVVSSQQKDTSNISYKLNKIVLYDTIKVGYNDFYSLRKCSKKDDLDIKWAWQNPKHNTLDRIIMTTLGTVVTAITDVVLYPIAERSKMVDSYRMMQGAEQLGVSLLLAREYGWSTAVGYNINMLFGVNDAIYYVFRPSEFQHTAFNHLNYTPFYILNGGRLSKNDFKVQTGIGFNFSILIQF